MTEPELWLQGRRITPDKIECAQRVLDEILQGADVFQSIRRHPLPEGGYVAKHVLVAVYRRMVDEGLLEDDPGVMARIRMKPTRTLSGVTTVTVLTGPHPCPGDCVFCPTDERMPKSYLVDEPGAARAFQNQFDAYKQVNSRLEAYRAVGHPTDKIELLILGGTWTFYPRPYQAEFIKRCFDAMNETSSPDLSAAQQLNENSSHRNVGLVIETRPDEISPAELAWLRQLGVTKVQIGAQSLDDHILELNRRGHDAAETLKAAALLRAAGFKIVVHWMPNLLGATPESDRADFARLWNAFGGQSGGICPDEIKIYPTQLLENTDLYQYWKQGKYQPYSTEELIQLVADVKATIPPYCRVNRVIRDISSNHVVEGNRRTSLRQDALDELARRGLACQCVRCREIRGQHVDPANLHLDDLVYHPAHAEEHFLSFVTGDNRIAGYLRLSLPEEDENNPYPPGLPADLFSDLRGAALIREVHVYGQSLAVGSEQSGAAQHAGLGKRLLQHAEEIARRRGFRRMAVIAAIGTRLYYQSRGFERGELYMVKELA
ncbi:MAG: tRNA uridine(34) 5-carboxymethylaminomethyl modification radical SAM/GNAT enzyme Elp3 [Anaerolineae bacterium]|nr:tRNA uridine(34) 5-carboxymethylaminomethyl modification radical SAM/GNAT enzyme Elp3 [Anaerolineae bacterium]